MTPDLTECDVDPGHQLRSGVHIALRQPPLRILETGYLNQQLTSRTNRCCAELGEQVPPLLDRIEDRHREGAAFVIMGDFNRSWMDAISSGLPCAERRG